MPQLMCAAPLRQNVRQNNMTEDDALKQFGLKPRPEAASEIRSHLISELRKEESESGDQSLIKLFFIQLFSIGYVEDSILIWTAKQTGFDLSISIDVQLLCGAGLSATKDFFRARYSEDARQALEYLSKCESAGDFERFSLDSVLSYYRDYYNVA